jgi:vacuolar-type H+-ATPase subunit H
MVEVKGQLIISEAIRVGEAEAAKMLEQARQEASEIIAKAREQAQSHESIKIPHNGERMGQATSEVKSVDIESQLRIIMPKVLETGFDIVMEATRKADTEANRIITQAKQTGLQIIEEANRKREDEANKIVVRAEETERQILEQARRKAEDEGNKIVTQAIQTGLQIIVEASRIADTEVEMTKRISQGESKGHRSIEEAKASAVNRFLTEAKHSDVEHEVQQLIKHKELANSLHKSTPIDEVAEYATAATPSRKVKSVLKQAREKSGSLALHTVLGCFSLWNKPKEA